MTHITNRTWTAADIERLKQLVEAGVSAARAAVIFRRSIVSVKAQAKRFGFPFPDERVLKRARKAREIQTEL
ncbi:mRNA degradation ribonuclease J1/J2 [Nitrobacteraceae bacterium AZCC 1564]